MSCANVHLSRGKFPYLRAVMQRQIEQSSFLFFEHQGELLDIVMNSHAVVLAAAAGVAIGSVITWLLHIGGIAHNTLN